MKRYIDALLTAISSLEPNNGDSNAYEGSIIKPLSCDLDGSLFAHITGNNDANIVVPISRINGITSIDQNNISNKGGHFIINISALTSSPSIIVSIQGKDTISGDYYDVLVSSPLNTVGMFILKVYPGINTIANESESDILPRTYRVKVTAANYDPITFSVSASLIL